MDQLFLVCLIFSAAALTRSWTKQSEKAYKLKIPEKITNEDKVALKQI